MLQKGNDLIIPTIALTCTIDRAHGVSIHSSIDGSNRSLGLHGQHTLLRDRDWYTVGNIAASKNVEHQNNLNSLSPSTTNNGHGAASHHGGLVASVQHIARDGYITNPFAIQASVELAGRHVSSVSFEEENEPLAMITSIDIVATAADESRVSLTRNLLTYTLFPRTVMRSQITQSDQDSYNLIKVTLQGLNYRARYQPDPIIADVAFDLLYKIEWQTCIPGGACHLCCSRCLFKDQLLGEGNCFGLPNVYIGAVSG